MNRNEAEGMVTHLLIKHAHTKFATGWRFGGFTRATKTLGVTKFSKKVIMLSGVYVDNHDRAHVEQTILHEIGHVLAGPAAGHGPEWRRAARSIGYTGGRTTVAKMPAEVFRWIGTCSAAANRCEAKYRRKPGERTLHYAVCILHRKPITWKNTQTGETVRPRVTVTAKQALSW